MYFEGSTVHTTIHYKYLCNYLCPILEINFYFFTISDISGSDTRKSIKKQKQYFTDLPSIFQDKYVISSIPDYFKNSEPPI